MILYIALSLFWLACGASAAYLAHTGLKHDGAQRGLPPNTPIGGLWAVWGPFLAGLVVLGAVALVCIAIIEWNRIEAWVESKR